MSTTITKGDRFIRSFESLSEFMALEEHPKNEGHNRYKNYNAKDGGRRGNWLGLPNVAAVEKAIQEGWTDGTAKARKLQESIAHLIPPAKNIKRRRRFSDSGDEIDIQKVYNGDLETAWSATARRTATGNPVKRILVSYGGNCGRSPEELFYKGVSAAILADVLEEAGYRVEIQAYNRNTACYDDEGANDNTWTFPLKAADEPLDFDRTITVTALAGFFRYYTFKAMLAEPRDAGSGLGFPTEAPPDEIKLPGDILLTNVYDEAAAVEMLKRELKKLETAEAAA